MKHQIEKIEKRTKAESLLYLISFYACILVSSYYALDFQIFHFIFFPLIAIMILTVMIGSLHGYELVWGYNFLYENILKKKMSKQTLTIEVKQIAEKHLYQELQQNYTSYYHETKSLQHLHHILTTRNTDLEQAVRCSLQEAKTQRIVCCVCNNDIFVEKGFIICSCNCESVKEVQHHLNG